MTKNSSQYNNTKSKDERTFTLNETGDRLSSNITLDEIEFLKRYLFRYYTNTYHKITNLCGKNWQNINNIQMKI